MWKEAGWQCKINVGIGCLLAHKTNGRYRYFHALPNEGAVFDAPITIGSSSDLGKFVSDLSSKDLQSRAIRRRPNTEWRLFALTNAAFYVYKLRGINRVGNARKEDDDDYPQWLVSNKHLLSLLADGRTGVRYEDNMCFFRCLALAKDCLCRNQCLCVRPKKSTVEKLFRHYLAETGMNAGAFPGVDEQDLVALEMMFDASITVFALKADGNSDVVLWEAFVERVFKKIEM